MDITSLKKHIYENNKIEYVLCELKCHNINYNSKHNYYSASFPDGDNPQGINIKNNQYLNYRSFSRDVSYDDEQDIIDLVQYITKKGFVDSVKYLHSLLNLQYTYKKKPEKVEEKPDPLWVFKKIQQSKKRVDVAEIHTLDEELINDYVPLLHINWFKEGIMEWTRKKFGIAYSYKRKRVMMPIRHWLTGELVGFNARTTVENYDDFDISKYWITPTYKKHLNVFGLWENRESIEKVGYVVIAESEKSVYKRHSLFDETVVALQGKSMSEEQRRILLGLNVKEIIIALDKDVSRNEVRHLCEQFYKIKTVSYMWDTQNLLNDKEAPMDASSKAYNYLFKYRVRYDEKEHDEYLKSLKKR